MRGLVSQSASAELAASARLLDALNRTLEINNKYADAISARLEQLRAPAPGLGQQLVEVINAVVAGGQALAMLGSLRPGAPGAVGMRPGPGGSSAPALPGGVRADVAALAMLQQLPPEARRDLAASLADPDKREAFFAVLAESEPAVSPAGSSADGNASRDQSGVASARDGVPSGPAAP